MEIRQMRQQRHVVPVNSHMGNKYQYLSFPSYVSYSFNIATLCKRSESTRRKYNNNAILLGMTDWMGLREKVALTKQTPSIIVSEMPRWWVGVGDYSEPSLLNGTPYPLFQCLPEAHNSVIGRFS